MYSISKKKKSSIPSNTLNTVVVKNSIAQWKFYLINWAVLVDMD